ncbi:hypothetical protein, partial [Flagellimonas marinaquae]
IEPNLDSIDAPQEIHAFTYPCKLIHDEEVKNAQRNKQDFVDTIWLLGQTRYEKRNVFEKSCEAP